MHKLESILAEVTRGMQNVDLGEGQPLDSDVVDSLDHRLKTLRSELELYFVVCVAMILVLFAAQIAIVIVYINQPHLVQAAVAAFGISASALIFLMTRLWRDRDRTATLIVLSTALGKDELRNLLDVMMQAYYPKSAPRARPGVTGRSAQL